MDCIEQIFDWFSLRGADAYFGEAVSQQEHALQAASLAKQDGASEALVAAALLHDIGHLLCGDETMAENGFDGRHEDAGNAWLKKYFGPAVTEPVRMHVAAKRYLCHKDPEYLAALSPASILSLKLQGGEFSQHQALEFERQPFADDAVRLRRWDDQAKVPGLTVPALESYRNLLAGQAHT